MSCLTSIGCQSSPYYDPKKPHHGKNGFLNNYDNSPKASFFKWQWERFFSSSDEPEFKPELVQTDLNFLKNNRQQRTLTWIGHASFFIQIEGLNILTDPVFSDRVSPVSFVGPKRQAPLPFLIHELPAVDLVVISHNHYDHLDLASLKVLSARDSKTLFLVPLGLEKFLRREGIRNVREVDWWDEVEVDELTVTLTPVQHWSSRGLFDRNESLWGGWHFKSEKSRIFFAGDTGYSKDFKDIYEKLGAVDLALLPIGAYAPEWFMSKNHVNPQEALQIHFDLKAKKSIGMHWGTFRLSDETMMAPAEVLAMALKAAQLSPDVFETMKHGETRVLE